jgi:hypothetical protein
MEYQVLWAEHLRNEDEPPAFEGTAERVREWLEIRLNHAKYYVHWFEVRLPDGQDVPAKAFLAGVKAADEAKIHARNTMVHQLVISAMQKQDRARFHDETDGMDIVAQDTAIAIIKLFEKED